MVQHRSPTQYETTYTSSKRGGGVVHSTCFYIVGAKKIKK